MNATRSASPASGSRDRSQMVNFTEAVSNDASSVSMLRRACIDAGEIGLI